MPSGYPAVTIILAEISIILLSIFAFLLFRYIRNRRDVTSALSKLANKLRCKKDERQETLKNFLQETCQFTAEKAEETAAELMIREKLFYSTLIEIYMNRNNRAIKNLDQTTEQVIKGYRDLLSASVDAINDTAQRSLEDRTHELATTIDELNNKNKDLSAEINVLRKEMEATITEYTSAFARKQAEMQAAEQNSASEKDTAGEADNGTSDSSGTTPDNMDATAAADPDESMVDDVMASSPNGEVPAEPQTVTAMDETTLTTNEGIAGIPEDMTDEAAIEDSTMADPENAEIDLSGLDSLTDDHSDDGDETGVDIDRAQTAATGDQQSADEAISFPDQDDMVTGIDTAGNEGDEIPDTPDMTIDNTDNPSPSSPLDEIASELEQLSSAIKDDEDSGTANPAA